MLREIELKEPIRYASNDPVEKWLYSFLCLDCASTPYRLMCGTPHPDQCELFYVNRDSLFSYHKLSEAFLQRVWSLYVSSHYKNSPDDLQLLSDAPAHQLFVLLGPQKEGVTLPEGLSLDPITGEIAGIPTALSDSKAYTIHGKNARSATFVEIAISVQKGYCAPDGVFDRTEVGETAVYECSTKGSYVGTQKRECVLGKKNGEWQKASGFCMPIFGMIAIILGAIIIVAVVIFILTRSRKTKAVGGVKGKGGKASKASGAKKSAAKSTKAVKV